MTALFSRLAALALLALIVAAAVIGIALPIRDAWRGGQEQIADLNDRIAAFRDRRIRAPASQRIEIADAALIVAESEALAEVALQQRVDRIFAAAGLSVASRNIEQPVPEAHWTRLSLRIDLTMPEPALQNLLYRLESGPTYLFVDQLELRRQGRGQGPGNAEEEPAELAVRLHISGLMQRPAP